MMNPTSPLSDLGEELASLRAESKAKRIDEQNSDWRYYLDAILGLVQIALVLSAILGFLILLATPFFNLPDWKILLKRIVLNLVLAMVLLTVRYYIANPHVNFIQGKPLR